MCPFSPVNSWNQTQSFDYFEIQRKRIASVDLGWVSQALDIIQREMISSDKLSLKDVGCQMFQFYKGLKKRKLGIKYYGYDLDESYIKFGMKYFPELESQFIVGDFTQLQAIKSTSISVCSATMEHIENWRLFLKKILSSSKTLCILRTFLGEKGDNIYVRATGALSDYPIWQFEYAELFDAIESLGWHPELEKDIYTRSLPVTKVIGPDEVEVVRTCFFVVCKPK